MTFGGEGLAVRPRLTLASAVALLLVALPSGAPPAIAAAYDRFYANFAGEELMRSMNADRAALGRSPRTRRWRTSPAIGRPHAHRTATS
jgi:hypothetical protein